MTSLEQTIMREIATLPADRQTNVLAYIRFLKLGLDMDEAEIEARFEKSWKRARARAKTLGIAQEDIQTEIRSVRELTASALRRRISFMTHPETLHSAK